MVTPCGFCLFYSQKRVRVKENCAGGGDTSGARKKAGAEIRTPDLLITNQLLYRLSYASV